MHGTYDDALKRLLSPHEGGYTNDAADARRSDQLRHHESTIIASM